MRFRHLFAPGLAAITLIALAPQPASACPWWGGYSGPAYGPGYYAPAPMYYAPAPTYYAPPPYYPSGPAPGVAPRMMPPIPTVPAPTTASAVTARDDSFEPPTLTVQPGTTVKWTNNGKHPHTVTDRGGKFDSGDIAPGASYTVTFSTPGTYKYYCKHHKGMEGTVVVGTQTGPAPGGSGSNGAGY